MIGTKDYIGIALDNETVDLARVRVNGKKIQVLDFVRHDLIEPLDQAGNSKTRSLTSDDDLDADDIFGIEEDTEGVSETDDLEEISFEDLDDLDDLSDLNELDDFEGAGVDISEADQELDLVDEADLPDSNELLLFNYLTSIGKKKKHNIGLNIRSGSAVFQFVRDHDYTRIKKKELKEIVENKLHSIYGEIPSQDQYSYFVRDDGTLSIVSIDKEPASLNLANRLNDLFKTSSVVIRDIMPDEVALTGLYRQNYPVADETKITALIQFGAKRCRIIFFKGHEVFQVSPVINEGTSDKGFLSTVFSKILFQLDTGEVHGLDRVVLCDNPTGNEAVNFFQRNFPDIEVENFELDPEIYEINEPDIPKVTEFTTALSIAVGASGAAEEFYPTLSIVPRYVHDRQKVFQLQWHGIALLIAIGLSPIILNHFYQQNAAEIEQLQTEDVRLGSLITSLQPVVEQTQIMEEMLGLYQGQLVLLDELSEENIRWTVSLDAFNQAVQDIGGLWITAFRHSPDGIIVEGVSLNEARIPALARQFGHVTLMNVRRDQHRERDVYLFTMRISRVVTDENLYTPEETRRITEFLESF